MKFLKKTWRLLYFALLPSPALPPYKLVDSFTQILNLINMKFIEVTPQKDPTPHFIILAMHIDPIVRAKAEKGMN